MKIRIFRNMENSVFCVLICTEDWSQEDIKLMEMYGEPEINVGGPIDYMYGGVQGTKTFGNEFSRILHGFPYIRRFDTRDYSSVDEAIAVGVAWKEKIVERLGAAVTELRSNLLPLPTEEVSEI